MSEIDQELRSGKKTVGQIATQFSVSKARIEAIRKLKEVEAEFKRQVSCKSARPAPVLLPLSTSFPAVTVALFERPRGPSSVLSSMMRNMT